MTVSVIIPTFNRAATIERAVRSVLEQSHPDLDLIVVDDGSTDGTASVLDKYRNRMRILQQANAGPSAARNAGVRAARGSVIAFLDSDDVWLPQKLEKQLDVLAAGGPQMPCCICNTQFAVPQDGCRTSFELARIDAGENGAIWHNPAEVLATRFVLFNQAIAIRREAFEKVGGFRDDLRVLEDYDLALKLCMEGPWGMIGAPMVIKHDAPGSLTVEAEKDPVCVLRLQESIISDLLAAGRCPAGMKQRLLSAKRDLHRRISAETFVSKPSAVKSTAGRIWRFALRALRAAKRRSPLWPRVRLTPIETSNTIANTSLPDSSRFVAAAAPQRPN